MKEKIGIFGGTFDPIHNGHLWFAETAREKFSLEKVIFIPNKIPPHREIPLATDKERYEMLLLATSDNLYFEVSDIEIKKEGKSYTIDTLIEFRQMYKEKELFLLIGEDAFSQFLSWKEPEKILKVSNLIVGSRGEKNFPKELDNFIEKYKTKIFFLEFPYFPISAKEIREKIREGKSIKYLVPPLVEIYIYKKRLYFPNSFKNLDKT